jgi:hypothetical protein
VLHRFLSLLCLLALAGLAVAGCGGTTIDHAKVEKLLVGKAPTGGLTVKSAKCPSGVEAKEGATLDCDVKLSDGTGGSWTVHVLNSAGLASASFADFIATGRSPTRAPSQVGQTKDVPAPGGARLRVTVVGYQPNVAPVSDDAMAHVATLTLRIVNASTKPFSGDSPSAMSILHNSDTAGDDSQDATINGSQPCQSSFWDKKLGLGRQKIFEVRKHYNDITFIDEFLTAEFAIEQRMFVYGFNEKRNSWEIMDREFRKVKSKLLQKLTNFGQPVIEVVDANDENRGELRLGHKHDGLDLKGDYARETLRNVQSLWRRPVNLVTKVEGKGVMLRYDGQSHSDKKVEL